MTDVNKQVIRLSIPKALVMATQVIHSDDVSETHLPLHGIYPEDRERIDRLIAALERIADALSS